MAGIGRLRYVERVWLQWSVRALAWRGAVGARRHWLILLLLACGTGLSAVTLFAYRPALFALDDSAFYLANADHLEPAMRRPLGYALFLRLLPLGQGLGVIPSVQHLIGLLMAVLIYVLLLRLGVRRSIAALAAAPVLLDAYQLNIEEYVLSDTLFQALLLGACVTLLWRKPVTSVRAVAAGLLLAAATVTRPIGLLAIIPAIIAVLMLKPRLRPTTALIAGFAIPVAAYVVWFHSIFGMYSLTGFEGRFLYARVATFANCSGLSLPQYERVLCPQGKEADRPEVGVIVRSRAARPSTASTRHRE